MSSYLKGKFLEYTLRKIMHRCGFTGVVADDIYTYEHGALFYVHGKGAAHDADVLMNPPIQMPFSYPSRILFECKSYKGNVGLPVIRNVLGLRNDINDFEIVTRESLDFRKNNRREQVAIHERTRYFYQVGVATLFGFTKPAIEFAANNKIPLFSLEATFQGSNLPTLINFIPDDIQQQVGHDTFMQIASLLSSKEITVADDHQLLELSTGNPLINSIVTELNRQINRVHIGVLESGEMIFISRNEQYTDNAYDEEDILNNEKGQNLITKIHWERENPLVWSLDFNKRSIITYSFFLPPSIAWVWKNFQEQTRGALQLKGERFSRIFVFSKTNDSSIPFNVLTLDEPWINELNNHL